MFDKKAYCAEYRRTHKAEIAKYQARYMVEYRRTHPACYTMEDRERQRKYYLLHRKEFQYKAYCRRRCFCKEAAIAQRNRGDQV